MFKDPLKKILNSHFFMKFENTGNKQNPKSFQEGRKQFAIKGLRIRKAWNYSTATLEAMRNVAMPLQFKIRMTIYR